MVAPHAGSPRWVEGAIISPGACSGAKPASRARILDYLRDGARRLGRALGIVSPEGPAKAALARLEGGHHAVLALRFGDLLPVAEVARALDTTPDAVCVAQLRALDALQQEIGQREPSSAR